MITYNHEKYIARALESILCQQTEYDYEVIIGEDCSTDRTREIISRYEAAFNGRLTLLSREKNLGMFKNVMDCLKHCSGKYIAFLEGDDYWIDGNKLQKQAEYMEQHKECIMTSHSWLVVNKEGEVVSKEHVLEDTVTYTLRDYMTFELPGQASTWMVRNQLGAMMREYMPLMKKYFWIAPDRSITLILLLQGELHIMPNVMSAYRYVLEKDGQNWSSKHDADASHNYIYVFLQILGVEHMAKEKGVTLNFYAVRRRVIEKSRIYYKQSHSIGVWLQGMLMAMLEPDKKRLLRELSHKRKAGK